MTAKLATPFFIGGAKDTLAAVDVYTNTSADVINAIPDTTLVEPADDLEMAALVGGSAMDQAVAGATAAADSYEQSADDALSQLQDAAPDVTDGLRDMTPAGAAALTQDMTSSLGGLADQAGGLSAMSVDVGGVVSPVTGSFGDAQAVTGMVNKLSGLPQASILANSGGLVGVLSGVINQASRIGMKGVFGPVMQYSGLANLGPASGAVTLRIASQVLPGIVKGGDFASLQSMGAVVGPAGMGALAPNVVGDVCRNYALPTGTGVAAMPQIYSQATGAFSSVNPNWNSTQFGGSTLPSITALQGASPDMRKVVQVGAMLSNDSGAKLHLLASVFPASSAVGSLSKSFPMTVVAGSARQITPAVTPMQATLSEEQATQAVLAQSPNYTYTPWDSDGEPAPTEQVVQDAINRDAAFGTSSEGSSDPAVPDAYAGMPAIAQPPMVVNGQYVSQSQFGTRTQTLSNGVTRTITSDGFSTTTTYTNPDGTQMTANILDGGASFLNDMTADNLDQSSASTSDNAW